MTDEEKAEKKRIYMREYARKRRASDPAFVQRQKENSKKSSEKNKQKRLEACKLWREKNKEKISEYNKQYSKLNRKKINDYSCEYNKQKRKSDPVFVLIRRERVRIHDALKGIRKTSKTETLLGCSYDFFRGYIEGKFLQGMGWDNIGEWHIDHIRPLSSFDLSDEEQQKQAFHYTNQQPLWAIDNLKKGAKYG